MTLNFNYTLAFFDIISMYVHNIPTELKKALKKDGFLSQKIQFQKKNL